MHDPVFMNVFDPCQDLLHKIDRFLLIEPLSLYDVVEKLASFSVLHYQMNICLGFDDLS